MNMDEMLNVLPINIGAWHESVEGHKEAAFSCNLSIEPQQMAGQNIICQGKHERATVKVIRWIAMWT